MVMSPSLARCARVARWLRHFASAPNRAQPFRPQHQRVPMSIAGIVGRAARFLGIFDISVGCPLPSALMLGPTRRMQARASADRSRPNGSRGSLGFTLHSTPKARFRGRQRVDASAASGRDRSDLKRARVAATAFGSREVGADACEQHGVRGSRRHARARSFDRKERTAKALGELRRILGRRALPVFPASTRIELA